MALLPPLLWWPFLDRRPLCALKGFLGAVAIRPGEVGLRWPGLAVVAIVCDPELPVAAVGVATREIVPAIVHPGDVEPLGVLDDNRHAGVGRVGDGFTR